MNKKIVAKSLTTLVLVITLIAGLAVPAFAFESEVMHDEITVQFPEGPGREFTLTNVSDRAYLTNSVLYVFAYEGGTISANFDMVSITVEHPGHSRNGSARFRYLEGEFVDESRYYEFSLQEFGVDEIETWSYTYEHIVSGTVLAADKLILDHMVALPVFENEDGFVGLRIQIVPIEHRAEVMELIDMRTGWDTMDVVSLLSFVAGAPVEVQPAPVNIEAANLDTAGAWAHESINEAFLIGLIPTALQSNYSASITRAEFASLAVTLYETVTGTEITGYMQFSDTNDVYVQKAGYIGVVTGIGNDNFAPNNTLTREQAAVMLARLAYVLGQPLSAYYPTFADNAQISAWAVDAVGQMQLSEIMGGVGNNMFAPLGDYTREQSIVTILRLFEEFN